MTFVIGLICGTFIGGAVGVIIMAILQMARDDDE